MFCDLNTTLKLDVKFLHDLSIILIIIGGRVDSVCNLGWSFHGLCLTIGLIKILYCPAIKYVRLLSQQEENLQLIAQCTCLTKNSYIQVYMHVCRHT